MTAVNWRWKERRGEQSKKSGESYPRNSCSGMKENGVMPLREKKDRRENGAPTSGEEVRMTKGKMEEENELGVVGSKENWILGGTKGLGLDHYNTSLCISTPAK